MSDSIRLGILGCGAITRNAHLQAALAEPCVKITALVDADLNRARLLQQTVGQDCHVAQKSSDIFGAVDAIINALPNYLHTSITLDALNNGIHVLCEKPLALTSLEGRACCDAAARKGLVLAVGMNRRFEDSQALVQHILNTTLLGTLAGYTWDYGSPWEWETESGFYFSRKEAGGGVLMDFGVHLLDSVLDWFGPVNQLACQHDDWGSGIEANAHLQLSHFGKFGEVKGSIRLSRTHYFNNQLVIRGSEARAVLPSADPSTVIVHRLLAGQRVNMTLRLPESGNSNNSFSRQMRDFIESIQKVRQPRVNGRQAVEVVELVERCYAKAGRIPEPWAAHAGLPQG